jgi:hypothetical protein
MTPDEPGHIRLSLEGVDEVDFQVYAATTADLDTLLRRVTARYSGGRDAHWVIQTEPVIHVTASPNGVSAASLGNAISDTYDAVAATRTESPAEWPATFQSKDRQLTRRIVNRLRARAPVRVEATDHEPLTIPPNERRSARLRPIFAAWSTVDGRLETVSVHLGTQFTLYEHGTGNPVRCSISRDRLREVTGLLEHTVRVHGFVYYRTNGNASSINASSITDVREIEVLQPPVLALDEFQGLIPRMTRELSAGEYVRRLRAGGDD